MLARAATESFEAVGPGKLRTQGDKPPLAFHSKLDRPLQKRIQSAECVLAKRLGQGSGLELGITGITSRVRQSEMKRRIVG